MAEMCSRTTSLNSDIWSSVRAIVVTLSGSSVGNLVEQRDHGRDLALLVGKQAELAKAANRLVEILQRRRATRHFPDSL